MRLKTLIAGRRATAVALGVIAALTIGGAVFLRSEVLKIEAEIPLMEVAKLRAGFLALADLNRLDDAVNWAVGSETVSSEQREEIQVALDHLFVRAEEFERLVRETGGEGTARVTETFDRIVAAGDRALARGPEALERFEPELDAMLETARAQLIHFVNQQYRIQSAAVAEQSRILGEMTLTTGVLLVILGLLAGTTVLLLQSEIRANRKRAAAEAQARFLAHFDPLTGLFNRTRFNVCADEIVASETAPAILLADLDDFKAVNDTHGHAVGDAVLRSVSERIQRLVTEREGNAARLGGDEFAAVLPGPLSRREAEAFCLELIDAIRAPVRAEGVVVSPAASLGICRAADLPPGETPGVSALLKAADLALYEAKARGRDAFVLHDRPLAARVAEQRELELALPEALRRGEIFAMFQPQIDLSTGKIQGVEALARWQRGNRLVEPSSFIPVAEATGLVTELDRSILRQATRTVADWIEDGAAELSVSVNLSPLHFRNSEIVEHVQYALAESGLRPALLTLEITESVLLENRQAASRVIEGLHALGVNVALDDFGTGYSSLSYLQQLAIDAIKIDRAFVRRLDESGDAQFILDALVGMARGLGMHVVIEGVETRHQLELARKLGCDSGQGFYFDRPMDAEDLRARLGVDAADRKAAGGLDR